MKNVDQEIRFDATATAASGKTSKSWYESFCVVERKSRLKLEIVLSFHTFAGFLFSVVVLLEFASNTQG